jgi:hypothetical protein
MTGIVLGIMIKKRLRKMTVESNKYSEELHGEQGRTRHGSPGFYKLLEQMAELHDRKSHDYARDNDPFGNYEFAGLIANMFSSSPVDAGFSGRLAEKIYRLYVLQSENKIPKTDTIDDTERDIAVIATLWMAARRDKRGQDLKGYPIAKEAAPNGQTLKAAPYSTSMAKEVIRLSESLNYAERVWVIEALKSTLPFTDSHAE